MENTSTGNQVDLGQLCVTWDQYSPEWFIAWKDGKPVSAFRFESEEVHRKRTWDDQQRTTVGLWHAWVPDGDSSRLLTWPEDTPVDVIKRELIAADVRLQ